MWVSVSYFRNARSDQRCHRSFAIESHELRSSCRVVRKNFYDMSTWKLMSAVHCERDFLCEGGGRGMDIKRSWKRGWEWEGRVKGSKLEVGPPDPEHLYPATGLFPCDWTLNSEHWRLRIYIVWRGQSEWWLKYYLVLFSSFIWLLGWVTILFRVFSFVVHIYIPIQ